MSDFDRFDDDNMGPKPNKHSEEDVRRFRELLRNGGKDINNPEALEEIIQFYFEHDKNSFELIKRKFLSKTWDNANIDIQIKEIAHNIRNKYNNMKLKQNRIHPKGQKSLFA